MSGDPNFGLEISGNIISYIFHVFIQMYGVIRTNLVLGATEEPGDLRVIHNAF